MELICSKDNVTVDFTPMQELLGEDYTHYEPVIQTFLNILPNTIASIEKGMNEKNWEMVYKAAHSAKSSLSVIKINNHYELVRDIELFARNEQNLQIIPQYFQQINAQWPVAKTIILDWLAQSAK
ncbi:MAG: hypothetical protein J0I09_10765 [Sphingobacteriia bacterium]|nr:hypothetical protein [Sphingobacteriia bacterium]